MNRALRKFAKVASAQELRDRADDLAEEARDLRHQAEDALATAEELEADCDLLIELADDTLDEDHD